MPLPQEHQKHRWKWTQKGGRMSWKKSKLAVRTSRTGLTASTSTKFYFARNFWKPIPWGVLEELYLRWMARWKVRSWSKRQIIDMVQSCVTTNLSKRASSLLESLKIQAYSEPLPVELDRIHCANGIYFLDGHFEPKKVFCNNRLSVSYNPAAPKPLRWLQFLSELLEEDDILTLQEYLGYCLIPSTKGQKMLMLIGRGGEGKSRIGLILNAMFHSAMNVGNIQKVETKPVCSCRSGTSPSDGGWRHGYERFA